MSKSPVFFLLVLSLLILHIDGDAVTLEAASSSIRTAGSAPIGTTTGCTAGNEDPSPQYVANFVNEQMEFAYLVEPSDLACCEQGFVVNSITFHLFIETFGDHITSPVEVGLRSAEGSPGSFLPGGELCVTPPLWRIVCDINGFYEFTIPAYPGSIADLECPCLPAGSSYFLFWRILASEFYGAQPDAVRDGTPVGGKSFVKRGNGPWEDAVLALGWTGEHIINSEITCCEQPVPTRSATWGRVKSLYR